MRRKKEYFVAWVAADETTNRIMYGSHLITSTYKGTQLLDFMIYKVQEDRPGAVITSITRLK